MFLTKITRRLAILIKHYERCLAATLISPLTIVTFLAVSALGAVGEGGISVISKALGEITGINGQLVIFLAGIFMVMSALGYARKAFQEARQYETPTIQDTVRHFSPVD